jgi:hypothetical protein
MGRHDQLAAKDSEIVERKQTARFGFRGETMLNLDIASSGWIKKEAAWRAILDLEGRRVGIRGKFRKPSHCGLEKQRRLKFIVVKEETMSPATLRIAALTVVLQIAVAKCEVGRFAVHLDGRLKGFQRDAHVVGHSGATACL